jgi:hypothetical protein
MRSIHRVGSLKELSDYHRAKAADLMRQGDPDGHAPGWRKAADVVDRAIPAGTAIGSLKAMGDDMKASANAASPRDQGLWDAGDLISRTIVDPTP